MKNNSHCRPPQADVKYFTLAMPIAFLQRDGWPKHVPSMGVRLIVIDRKRPVDLLCEEQSGQTVRQGHR